MRVIFRADASATLGSGHIMRCLTLALALREEGRQIQFVTQPLAGHCIGLLEQEGFEVRCLNPITANNSASQTYNWQADAESTLQVIGNDEVAEWLVVDHYQLDARWEQRLRPFTERLMVIDDLADRPHAADLLLDQNLIENYLLRYQSLIEPACGLMLGPRYAMLQPPYAVAREKLLSQRADRTAQRVLVYFGAADQFELTSLAVDCLRQVFGSALTIEAILPSTNPQWPKLYELSRTHSQVRLQSHVSSLADVMSAADFAIGASGATSWERLCLGLPALMFTLAPNQVPIAQELHNRRLATWLGDVHELTPSERQNALIDCLRQIHDQGVSAAFSQTAMSTVDGRGVDRVVAAMLCDSSASLTARSARLEDSDLLLEWANDWITRRNAFSPQQISRDTHERWYQSKLGNYPASQIYIVEINGQIPLGQVRFENDGSEWELHYSLASAFRGRRLASKMLGTAIEALRQHSARGQVFGRVKRDNDRSSKVFRSLGFDETTIDDSTLKFTLSLS